MHKGTKCKRAAGQNCRSVYRANVPKVQKGAEVPMGKRARVQKQSQSAIVQKGIRAEV